MTVIPLLLSCNHENSEIQEVSNSIEENTRRANEMSTPLFSKDSMKNDYKFKINSPSEKPIDSSLIQLMEERNEKNLRSGHPN